MQARRCIAVLAGTMIASALVGTPAQAAAGSISDPRGDAYPDVLKLAFVNGDAAVKMTMTHVDVDAAESEWFFIHWGTVGKRYAVLESRSAGQRELLYYSGASAVPVPKACAGLKVIHRDAYDRTKVVIPRSCISKAPNGLRFSGKATAGIRSFDETKKSPRIARG